MFGNPKYRNNATNRNSMVFEGPACVSSCAFARRWVQEKSPWKVAATVSVGTKKSKGVVSEQSGSRLNVKWSGPCHGEFEPSPPGAGAPVMVASGYERVLVGHSACRLCERGEP